jgi:hypothetical protein
VNVALEDMHRAKKAHLQATTTPQSAISSPPSNLGYGRNPMDCRQSEREQQNMQRALHSYALPRPSTMATVHSRQAQRTAKEGQPCRHKFRDKTRCRHRECRLTAQVINSGRASVYASAGRFGIGASQAQTTLGQAVHLADDKWSCTSCTCSLTLLASGLRGKMVLHHIA